MPRQVRIVLPGISLHVVQRGNDRNACFRRDGDRVLYLHHLRDLAGKHVCAVHAYCLMTNHVHLLLTPSITGSASELMRDLGQRYVQYVNRTYGRTGTLWEGRFRSCVVESARYVLACYRYIELNPVRAGMVGCASEYPWSSHLSNAGLRADRLLTSHPEFVALASDEAKRHKAYREFFEHSPEPTLEDDIRVATSGGYPLGSESFKRDLALSPGQRLVPGRPGRRPRRSDKNDLKAQEIGL